MSGTDAINIFTGLNASVSVKKKLDVFITRPEEPDEQFERIREAVTRTFFPLDIAVHDPNGFSFGIQNHAIGEILVTAIGANTMTVHRQREHVRRSSIDKLCLIQQLEGECDVRCNDSITKMRAGDWVLVDPHVPHDMDLLGEWRQQVVQIPQWWLRQSVTDERALMTGQRIPSGLPITKVLAAAADQLLGVEDFPDSRVDISEVFVDVLIRSLDAVRRSEGQAPMRSIRGSARVFDYVARNFHDPAISPSGAADALGCSVRYIHKVCALAGVTFSRLVAEARLSEAARLLRHGSTCSSRISEIAYRSGFTDLSHFSRSFRSRYGVSPKGYRV